MNSAKPLPDVDYAQARTGPAPEIDNQLTSNPIAVENLPEPVPATAEAAPTIKAPAPRAAPAKPPKITAEPRRPVKTYPPAEPPEVHPPVQQAPIQLQPQLSQSDRESLLKKINEQLESAKGLVKSLNPVQLSKDSQTSLNAVFEFIQKSEDAVKRGEYYQGLVLAQKANTLASTIVTNP
ncbi:MAG: hypothetical protein U0V70_14665 [Terriglobia bacterium]